MKKAMFIGPIGCGKTTLIQRLNEMQIKYNKTQTIEYYDNIIDTPGEYVEHRFMYSNLMTSAMGADVIVLMQSATDLRVILPTGFSSMFSSPTIGIVTKTDIDKDADVAIVKDRLNDAGAEPIISISSYNDTNIDKVSALLA